MENQESAVSHLLPVTGDETLQYSSKRKSMHTLSAQYGGKWLVSGSNHFTLQEIIQNIFNICDPNDL
jgi:hypothetical protein